MGAFDNATIIMIQSTNLTDIEIFYYLVTVDNRTNTFYPPGLPNNVTFHIVAYDGVHWFDFGQFGIPGPQGPQGMNDSSYPFSSEKKVQTGRQGRRGSRGREGFRSTWTR